MIHILASRVTYRIFQNTHNTVYAVWFHGSLMMRRNIFGSAVLEKPNYNFIWEFNAISGAILSANQSAQAG